MWRSSANTARRNRRPRSLLAEQWPLERAETRRELEPDPAPRVSAEVESLGSLRGAVSPSAVVVAVDLLGEADEAALADLVVTMLLIGSPDDGDRAARLLSSRVRSYALPVQWCA